MKKTYAIDPIEQQPEANTEDTPENPLYSGGLFKMETLLDPSSSEEEEPITVKQNPAKVTTQPSPWTSPTQRLFTKPVNSKQVATSQHKPDTSSEECQDSSSEEGTANQCMKLTIGFGENAITKVIKHKTKHPKQRPHHTSPNLETRPRQIETNQAAKSPDQKSQSLPNSRYSAHPFFRDPYHERDDQEAIVMAYSVASWEKQQQSHWQCTPRPQEDKPSDASSKGL